MQIQITVQTIRRIKKMYTAINRYKKKKTKGTIMENMEKLNS